MAQRICRQCLLREMDKEQYFSSIHAYVSSLHEDEKAPEALYEQRLSHCQQCDSLMNGMCRLCGCFVEVRAAKKLQHCPAVHPIW